MQAAKTHSLIQGFAAGTHACVKKDFVYMPEASKSH